MSPEVYTWFLQAYKSYLFFHNWTCLLTFLSPKNGLSRVYCLKVDSMAWDRHRAGGGNDGFQPGGPLPENGFDKFWLKSTLRMLDVSRIIQTFDLYMKRVFVYKSKCIVWINKKFG
ncbi:hypothetical protein CLV98_105189 [Dyadobacter jejuensis]|uniref:Uncharacterized protein n=1 Tax=Dyadobacter jejuensis TaxID=1082580 RepID=A0A316AL79_9BACT|nr:hypothetical protein CLV98_105189 [Dyadobacter jejuensis]